MPSLLHKPASRAAAAPADAARERRAHHRLDARLHLRINRLGETHPDIQSVTRNVSAGGIYFEVDDAVIRPGDLLHMELTLPASEGVFATEGRARCEAEVLRVLRTGGEGPLDRYGVAARLINPLRFEF